MQGPIPIIALPENKQQKRMKLIREIATVTGKILLYSTLGIVGLAIYIGIPLLVNEISETGAGWALLIESLVVIVAIIWWKKKHPLPSVVVQEESKETTGGVKAFLLVMGVLMVIGMFSDENKATPLSESEVATETNTPTFNPSKYYTPPAAKTFYTNALTNIRACASSDCEVLAQTAKNTPVSLNYSSTNELPEWVPVTWTDAGIQKQAYIHKSTLSSTYSYTPTYSYPSTVHYDDSYKYNYRTGYSGNYDYNYDVSGYGDNGYIYGNIDTSGKYGEGYVYDEDGNEVYVETEWIDYGVLEATDEYGNTYELEVD